MSTLKLHFDVTSPYAWIAFESLLRYEKHLGVALKLVPVHLGFIIRDTGNRPPGAIPKKLENMYRDLEVVSNYWGFHIRPPSDFNETIMKRGTLNPQRFLTALDVHQPGYLIPCARAFWERIWYRDEPIHAFDNIREVCDKLRLPEYEKMIKESTSEDIKSLYKQRTEEAIGSGAFGVPWILLSREGQEDVKFFGSDRLPIICHILGKPYLGPMEKSKM